ncbi:hypothetical protein JVU11DRAFT_5243 [Chiua virens]|nr:hypothetical protein JVU11DRAFT_5243 [Chiua virens]
MALLRLQLLPCESMKQSLHIPRTIGSLDIDVLRIDRRPSLCTKPFDDVYFLEVGAIPVHNNPERPWKMQLQQAVDKVKSMGVEVSILGWW